MEEVHQDQRPDRSPGRRPFPAGSWKYYSPPHGRTAAAPGEEEEAVPRGKRQKAQEVEGSEEGREEGEGGGCEGGRGVSAPRRSTGRTGQGPRTGRRSRRR